MPDNKIQIILEAYDKTKAAFGEFQNSFKSLKDQALNVQNVFKGLIYSAPFIALAGAMKKAVNTGEELWKISQQIGISVEHLSGLKFAAELSETSLEALTTSMGIFSKGIAGISEEVPQAGEALKLLGINTKDSNGNLRGTYAVLLDVADRFSRMEDGAGKTALAMRMFGRSGKELIPLLNEGAAGIRTMYQEAERMGLIFTEKSAKAADDFNDNIKKLKGNLSGLIITITNEVIPSFNQLFEVFRKGGPEKIQLQHIDAEMKQIKKDLQGETVMAKLFGWLPGFDEGSKRRLAELEKLRAEIVKVSGPEETKPLKKPAPVLPEINDELKKLAEQWEKTKDALQLKVSEMGLDEYNVKLIEIETTYKKIEEIATKVGIKDRTLIEKAKWVDIMKAYQEELLKEEAQTIESAKKKEEVQKWLTDQINELSLSEFDYKRANLFKTYEEQPKVLGWTEELYKIFQGKLKLIDDEEVEHKKAKLQQIKDLEYQHQLAIIDLKEKSFGISKGEAIEQKLEVYNNQLESLKQQYDETLGIAEKDLLRFEILNKIADIDSTIVGLLQQQKELSGDFIAGLREGINRYLRDAQTAFQAGLQVVEDITSGMKNAFQSFFDVTSKKFMDFKELVLNILNDIYQSLVKNLIIEPLVKGITGALGSLFGGGGGASSWNEILGSGPDEWHKGGYVIPRFHPGGLMSDERMAILQTGEYVVSRRGVQALDRINQGNISQPNVEVHNEIKIENKGLPVTARVKSSSQRFDGKKIIKSTILEFLATDPDFKNSLHWGLR